MHSPKLKRDIGLPRVKGNGDGHNKVEGAQGEQPESWEEGDSEWEWFWIGVNELLVTSKDRGSALQRGAASTQRRKSHTQPRLLLPECSGMNTFGPRFFPELTPQRYQKLCKLRCMSLMKMMQ